MEQIPISQNSLEEQIATNEELVVKIEDIKSPVSRLGGDLEDGEDS